MNLCKDCKHRDGPDEMSDIWRCKRTEREWNWTPVDGSMKSEKCFWERRVLKCHEDDADICGPEGKYWEPADPIPPGPLVLRGGARRAMNWISVKDRLPVDGQTVLIYVPEGVLPVGSELKEDKAPYTDHPWDDRMAIMDFQADRTDVESGFVSPYWGITYLPSHWMPMPEPPSP